MRDDAGGFTMLATPKASLAEDVSFFAVTAMYVSFRHERLHTFRQSVQLRIVALRTPLINIVSKNGNSKKPNMRKELR